MAGKETIDLVFQTATATNQLRGLEDRIRQAGETAGRSFSEALSRGVSSVGAGFAAASPTRGGGENIAAFGAQAVRSTLGTGGAAVGGALGGPVGAAVGRVVGEAAGFATSVAITPTINAASQTLDTIGQIAGDAAALGVELPAETLRGSADILFQINRRRAKATQNARWLFGISDYANWAYEDISNLFR